MTIQQCKYVLEIARTGSFNEASKSLFIAQSSLSNSVKLLEKELNIKIFIRSQSGVYLTAEGAEFTRYAEQLVSHSDFIENRYLSKTDSKKLHVVTQHYDFVADAFCRLINECGVQKFHFSLREIKTHDVIKEIETASSDIGIIAIKKNDYDIMTRYLSKKNIVFKELTVAYPHVFVRNKHPLSNKTVIKSEELSEFPYVSYEQGSHSGSFFTEEIFMPTSAEKRVEISDRATLMNALLTTDCYTVGTGIMPSALNDQKIKCIPFESDLFYHIGYITREDRRNTGLTQKFVLTLKNFLETQKKASE